MVSTHMIGIQLCQYEGHEGIIITENMYRADSLKDKMHNLYAYCKFHTGEDAYIDDHIYLYRVWHYKKRDWQCEPRGEINDLM